MVPAALPGPETKDIMGVNIMDEVSSWTNESLQVPKIIKTGKE